MDPIILISVAAFVGASALGAIIYSTFGGGEANRAEDRLATLAGKKSVENEAARALTKKDFMEVSQGAASVLGKLAGSLGSFGTFMEQANSPIDFQTLVMLSAGLGALGGGLTFLLNLPVPIIPVFFLLFASLPTIWLHFRRSRRFKKFGQQLPDALSLIGRALRSGHSLNAGLNMVVEEMPEPIGTEFQIAYEEQNLGIPIETALKNMMKRIPNMDMKFFVTAVSIQRQTGGDLAEIIDKICEVVRERFKILGLVQALTGEGRLSGAVLMALPVALFIAVYCLNPEYVMLLFTTPVGKQMIGGAIFLQVIGAYVIKKIIDIKV